MKKEEFLNELRNRLSGLSGEGIEERIQYYGELIDHRMETGQTEEDAVAGIGSLDETVGRIMSEIPLSKLLRHRVDPAEKHSAARIVVLAVLFPIWFPLIIALFAVFLSLYITAWVLWIALFFVAVAILLSALGSIAAAVGYGIVGRPLGGIFLIGLSLILAGISLLFFVIDAGISKGMLKLTSKLVLFIKKIFIRHD